MIEPPDKSPPIEPQEFLGGVKVVDIGDLRVARGLSRRPFSSCRHPRLHYDKTERRVWCPDCEQNIDAFDAFEQIVGQFDRASKDIRGREAKVSEVEGFQARSLAAKAMDEAWRKRSMVPACPHCSRGLMPEDFAKGVTSWVGREIEVARRKKGIPNA